MKKKILVPLVLVTLTAFGVMSFSLLQKQKLSNPPPTAMTQTPAPAAPAPVPDSPETRSEEVPTRPATAEEIKRCDAEDPLADASWPITRSWRIGRNNALNADLCLATVTIQLKNGKTAVVSDDIIDAEEAMANNTYAFRHYFKDEGFFAVGNSFMENGTVSLISDETGEQTFIHCSMPVFSPARTALFSFCTESDGEATTNSIGVWNRSGGTLKEAYAVDDLPWTPTELKWVDEDTIVLDQVTRAPEGQEETIKKPAKITRKGDSWVMDPPMPPKAAE